MEVKNLDYYTSRESQAILNGRLKIKKKMSIIRVQNLRMNSYSSLKLICPKCDELLELKNTIYVRGEPKQCKRCESKLIFGCRKCSSVYKNRQTLQDHMRNSCNKNCTKLKHCNKCGKEFKYLKVHLKHCSGNEFANYLSCNKCRKRFTTTWYLKKHKNSFCSFKK